MQLEVATGSYQSDSLPLSAQQCINWIPVVPQTQALSKRALFEAYGIETQALTGDSIVGMNRGAQKVNGVPYFVNGQNLYSIDSSFIVADLGSIVGTKRVSMANNGRWLVIVVPGSRSYAFDNETNTLSQITDLDFQVSDTVSFKDGFFIFTSSDGKQFFHSNLNQPLVISALDFGTAEVRPDNIVAAHVNHNELYVLGEDTIELFRTIGGFNFAFQRVPGGDTQKGLHAKHSVIDFDNSFVFLGGGVNELTAVWRMGGGASKLSTSAIDNAIQEYTKEEISNAFAMSYSYSGNYFVSFTFTSDRIPSKTFVYDATTSALSGVSTWHERQSGIAEDKWRVTSIVNAYGNLYVGDSVDGRIGVMKKDVFQEYGSPIFRQKTTMAFDSDRFPIFVNELKLTMETGVGTIAGLDPKIRMDFSDDHGRTFSNGYLRSYGLIGDYQSFPSWRRQGRVPRDRVVRFTTTEPVKSVVIRLDASIEQGVQM